MKILIDFNNLAMRTMHLHQIDVTSENPSWNFWKYLIFSTICNFVIEETVDYDPPIEVILACDTAEKSWRHNIYEPYKGDRKKDSDIDWDQVWEEVRQFQASISNYLPWQVLSVPGAEADDVIAVLATLDPEERIIVHSGDHDYLQLISDTVEVYNPHHDNFVSLPTEVRIAGTKVKINSVEEFLQISILTGQGGKDNVYNVKTPTDWQPQPGKRKPPFGVKAAQKALAAPCLEQYLTNLGFYDNYLRNKKLIDFTEIPEGIRQKIIETYKTGPEQVCDVGSFLYEYQWPSFFDKQADLQEVFAGLSGVEPTTQVEAVVEAEVEEEPVEFVM